MGVSNWTNGDEAENLLKFNWIEYATLGSVLAISALIGIYYGWIKGNQNTVAEYMLGGKSMHIFPIAMSLIASHISGVTLLGVPCEVYEFGTQYITMIFSALVIVYVTNKFYLPVFFDLQFNSIYEYLELRFSHVVRKIASFIFLVNVILTVPVIIYIPALAVNQVTGISVHVITPVVCGLCIFYTTIGGLKAVVWTDTIQGIFTFLSVGLVTILGVISVGGIGKIFEVSNEGGRLELFNMDPDPFARNTFWTVTFGTTFLWFVHLAVHPGSVQRFISLPSITAAKWSVFIFGLGLMLSKLIAVFIGLIIYTKYSTCDPVRSKQISKSGQLFPFYVQDVALTYPGLTGLFLSGLVSAALSTMSAGLNTVAGTIYEDFLIQCMPHKATDAQASFILKIIVVVIGTICVFLVYVVENLGTILQLSISLHGVTNGAIFTIFALGVLIPWINNKGALSAMVSSVLVMTWIVSGAQVSIYSRNIQFLGKPTSVTNCTTNNTILDYKHHIGENMTEFSPGVYSNDTVFPLYRLSYMLYTAFGSAVGILVGIVVSWMTGWEDLEDLDPKLITPVMRRFLPKRNPFIARNNSYNQVAEKEPPPPMVEMKTIKIDDGTSFVHYTPVSQEQ